MSPNSETLTFANPTHDLASALTSTPSPRKLACSSISMAARQPRRANYTGRIIICPPSSPASMLAWKKEVVSSKAQGVAREAVYGVAGASSSATVTVATGHDMAISEFVARFASADEAARKRLNRMKDKLKKLETQMEALEAEMSKASDFSQWD